MSFGPREMFSTRRAAVAFTANVREQYGLQILETWWATMSVVCTAAGNYRVYKSDDGLMGTCEIDLLGKLGAV